MCLHILFAQALIGVLVKLTSGLELNLDGVLNFRPVFKGARLTGRGIYRSASLDSITVEGTSSLLPSLACVVDLRNLDEISKGAAVRSEGATLLYSKLQCPHDNIDGPRLYHVPLLEDVDAFWEEAITRMPPGQRVMATLNTIFTNGALDRAAARHLEKGGLPLLYLVMLATAPAAIKSVLEICLAEGVRGQVVFHCQKGKDRTGVIAMFLAALAGCSDAEIVESYSESGPLIGEGDGNDYAQESSREQQNRKSSSAKISWSYFRGSPKEVMVKTLAGISSEYGSVDGYLDRAGFDNTKRADLKRALTQEL